MRYHGVVEGRFLSRPNRFVAEVETADGIRTVHVKNTGRCRELLVPGAPVYLEPSRKAGRRTAFDLIAVRKGTRLINMDAQAPNRVFGEWVSQRLPAGAVRPETRYGASRLDFRLETAERPWLVEVKGVTLEEGGAARFPDAPTERGVRHIQELRRAAEEGLGAALVFIVQMEDVDSVSPNDETHPAFGASLREAAAHGVAVCAFDCAVTEDSIVLRRPVPVSL